MSPNSYQNHYKKIYSLQDEILKLAEETNFYLTGGTALSRFYLKHRYSDDLDLFINKPELFKENRDILLERIEEYYTVKPSSITDSFIRLDVKKNNLSLKVDLVHDVPYHLGGFNSFTEFPRVDNMVNILSNKICALTRQEVKDVVDIVCICENIAFAWKDIIEAAQKKEVLEELYIVDLLLSFPVEDIKTIKWTKKPDFTDFQEKAIRIARDIARKDTNSLCLLK